jgi:hypothetical protein
MTERNDDREKRQDEALEALVADALSSRGELLPTTDAEVARAEHEGVEFEGELPESLRAFNPVPRALEHDHGSPPVPSGLEHDHGSPPVPGGLEHDHGPPVPSGLETSIDHGSPGSAPPPATGGLDDESTRSVAAQPTRESRTDNVVNLDDARTRRQGWLGYASAGMLGAAAASIFWIWFGGDPQQVAPLPAGDPSHTAPTSSAPTPPVAIGAVRACQSPCCAGPACATSEEFLKECSSGRSCIPCSLDQLQGSLYRLRIGSLALSPAGAEMREKEHWGPLELCVRVGSSDSTCIPAHAGTTGDEVWSSLPMAVSAQDLAAGFELQVRRKGDRNAMATWKHAVLTNPTLLCRGLSVSPKLGGVGNIGTLSVFFEDTHFVELGRNGNVPDLLAQAERIAFADVAPEIFETSAKGNRHFALVLGPLDKLTAERLRWKLLDANLDASISLGADHVGQPREIKR